MSVRMPTHLLPYLKQADVKSHQVKALDTAEALEVEVSPIPEGPGFEQIQELLKKLKRIDFESTAGPWIAGGAARRLYQGQALNQGDIDIFVPSYEVVNKLSKLLAGEDKQFESRAAISYRMRDSGLKVQIIKRRYYKTMEDLMNDFDFTVAQFVTDGKMVFASRAAADDLAMKRLCYAANGRVEEISMLKRLVKYANYGFMPEYGMMSGCIQSGLDYNSASIVLGSVAKMQDSNYGTDPDPDADTDERRETRNQWAANAEFNVGQKMAWLK